MVKHVKIYIYTDGACRRNPGPSAIGIVIFDVKGLLILEHKECIGQSTNNRAEYMALIRGLELATRYCRREIKCFLDSELVVNQVSGVYAIKNEELKRLFYLLKEKETAFEKVTYNWVPRTHEHIQKADKLVNKALDGEIEGSIEA